MRNLNVFEIEIPRSGLEGQFKALALMYPSIQPSSAPDLLVFRDYD